MKSGSYKVKRENIYAGKLIMTSTIYRIPEVVSPGLSYMEQSLAGKLTYNGEVKNLRTILFTIETNGLGSDLLYDASYPILNLSCDDLCEANSPIIDYNVNLDELLKYFEYPEELALKDIIKIRKMFFDGHFAINNCGLFGYSENIIDSTLIRRILMRIGYKTFKRKDNLKNLPSILWYAIDNLDDLTIEDLSYLLEEKELLNSKWNAFSINQAEGKVKKLTKHYNRK